MDVGNSFTFAELTNFTNYTLPKFEQELRDAAFNEITYLNKMQQYGGVITGETGEYIMPKFLMDKNDSVAARLLRDRVPLRGQDLTRFGKQVFAEYSGGIAVDYVTRMKNAGKERVIAYYDTEFEVLKKTVKDTFNQDLMTGSGSHPTILGIDSLINETVTSGSIHSVPRSGNTWVRNIATASTCSTTVGFGVICVRELSELIKQASPGMAAAQNGMFQMALMDDQIYAYANYYMPRIDNTSPVLVKNAEKGAKYAYQGGWMIDSAEAIWDHAAPADSIRMINTDSIKIHILEGCDFKVLPQQFARDSFNSSIVMGVVAAHVNHNPKFTGVLYNFNS